MSTMKFIIRSLAKEIKKNYSGSAILILTFIIAENCPAQNTNRSNKIAPMGIEVNTYTGNVYINRQDIYIYQRDDLTLASVFLITAMHLIKIKVMGTGGCSNTPCLIKRTAPEI
jgi:hypothetical protein